MYDNFKEKHNAFKKVKKDFDLKVAFAKRTNDEEAIQVVEANRAKELKRVTAMMAEKSTSGKNYIKDKFNKLVKNKKIDTKELI